MKLVTRSTSFKIFRWIKAGEIGGSSGSGRERRAFYTALSAAAAKLITVATMLISVPLTLHYLGPERYGIWMAMSSAVFAFSFADLGIGNALLALVADANGRDDDGAVRTAVSTAIILFLSIAIFLLATFFAAYSYIPWELWFNVQSEAARADVGPGFAVLVVCFVISIPLSLTSRTQAGLQEGFKSNLWTAIGSVLALLGVWMAIRFEAGLPWLVAAFAGAPLIASLVNGAHFFACAGRGLAPNLRFASFSVAKSMVGAGAMFLGIQMVVAVNVASDNLIIARSLGPEAVTAFAVPERMFGLIPILIHLALQPLWPAYSEALARNDHRWIEKTFRWSFAMAFVLSASGSLALFAFGNRIIELWTNGAVSPSSHLLAGLGLWKIADSIEFALTVLLTSANVLKFQLTFAFFAMLSALAAKICFVSQGGIDILPWISGGSRGAISLLPLYFLSTRTLKLRRVR